MSQTPASAAATQALADMGTRFCKRCFAFVRKMGERERGK